MPDIVVIVHNLRSSHNVGSILRTADGVGVATVYLTGYTPYPLAKNDSRLPYLSARVDKQIAKTALGAEKLVHWQHQDKIEDLLDTLKSQGYSVVALEQTPSSISLVGYKPPKKIALILGNELTGIDAQVLSLAEQRLAIPMLGRKESYNVAVAAAIALYHCRFNA